MVSLGIIPRGPSRWNIPICVAVQNVFQPAIFLHVMLFIVQSILTYILSSSVIFRHFPSGQFIAWLCTYFRKDNRNQLKHIPLVELTCPVSYTSTVKIGIGTALAIIKPKNCHFMSSVLLLLLWKLF